MVLQLIACMLKDSFMHIHVESVRTLLTCIESLKGQVADCEGFYSRQSPEAKCGHLLSGDVWRAARHRDQIMCDVELDGQVSSVLVV